MPKKHESKNVHELEDVEVMSVGLVPDGANQSTFFLTKEDDEDDWDDDTILEELEKLADEPPAEADQSAWQKLLRLVAQVVDSDVNKAMSPKAQNALKMALRLLSGIRDELPPEGKKAVSQLAGLAGYGGKPGSHGYGKPAKEGYPQPAQKSAEDSMREEDRTPDQGETESEQISKTAGEASPAVIAQLQALEKARESLVERLEKTEQELAAEKEMRRQTAFLEKARSMIALPTKSEELADQLSWLEKQDSERAAWWESLLRAVDHQLVDSDLFQEHGSRAPLPEPMEQALSKAAKGEASLRELLLSMPPEDQAQYLREQRMNAKEV